MVEVEGGDFCSSEIEFRRRGSEFMPRCQKGSRRESLEEGQEKGEETFAGESIVMTEVGDDFIDPG